MAEKTRLVREGGLRGCWGAAPECWCRKGDRQNEKKSEDKRSKLWGSKTHNAARTIELCDFLADLRLSLR